MNVADRPLTGALGEFDELREATPPQDDLAFETEVGVAEYFARNYGDQIRHIHGSKTDLVWDARRYRLDDDGAANRLVMACVRELAERALSMPAGDARQRRIKFILSCEKQRTLFAILSLARSMKPIAATGDAFDRDPTLFNTADCTVNLRTGDPLEHRQSDMIRQLSSAGYEPTARCERWKTFISEIMCGREDQIEFLRRAIGYTLTGLTRENVFFVLFGAGANGKSVFMRIFGDLLGDYAVSASPETFIERREGAALNDLARLAGARLVAVSESGENRRLSESLVKSVTGGEKIAARYLFREHFEYTPAFKLWLSTNHRPVIRGGDDGIWRRVRLIPFDAKFEGIARDAQLYERLKDELPGILAWAVEGAIDYLRDGLGTAAAVEAATAEYRSDMDVFAAFLEQNFAIETNAFTPTAVVVDAYARWSQTNRERTLSTRSISSKLKDRGFSEYRTKTKRGFIGLKAITGDVSDAIGRISDKSSYARVEGGFTETPPDESSSSPFVDDAPVDEGEFDL